VEDALREQGISFAPNVGYHAEFIKPDVLIPGKPPKFSVHVTATGADDSFRMKKWRYIDEVLQMRSVWGNRFVAINVLFGPISGYQAGDRLLMKRIFDAEIAVHDFDSADVAFKKALAAVAAASPGDKSRDIATAVVLDPSGKKTVRQLGKVLKKILDSSPKSVAPKAACDILGRFLKERDTYLKAHPPVASGNAAWKRSALRFLAVAPKHWATLHGLAGKEVDASSLDPRLVQEALSAQLVKIREGVGGIRVLSLSAELTLSIRAGLSLSFLESVKKAAHADPRRKYELEDLWDGGIRARAAVSEVAGAIGKGRPQLIALVSRSIEKGGSPKVAHHRAHVLDVILAATGLSQNQLQDRYPGPGVGVTDPVRNMVPRTELALQVLKTGKLDPIAAATAIVKSIRSELDAVKWSDTSGLSESYLSLRVFNLTKGSSIDPLEEYVSAELIRNRWKVGEPAIVSSNPIVGKVKTIFSAVASKKGRVIVLKCLFGDTGADHKAEEMEARMRMLRLDPPPGVELTTVFVADGKWNSSNLRCLVLGGWDHVVDVAEFPKLLRSLG
jgi:hypothetical protein